MGKKSKSEDPDWTPSCLQKMSENDLDDTSESFFSDEYFSDIEEVSDYDSESPETTLENEYLEYESILDHQNSIFCSNAYADAFGVFPKYLAQFKTVLEQVPVTPEDVFDDDEDEFPPLPQPFHQYLEVILKEESPIKSCLYIEVIEDEVPAVQQEPVASTSQVLQTPMRSRLSTPFTPQQLRTPVASSTPYKRTSSSTSKIPSIKNSSILDYFKVRNKNEETGGIGGGVKRKWTDEMEPNRLSQQENINPAKKILIVNWKIDFCVSNRKPDVRRLKSS